MLRNLRPNRVSAFQHYLLRVLGQNLLCDLNQEVGFTQFWVGSHVTDGLIGFGAAAEVLRGCVDGVVDAGGFVAYDYRTMHRGMRNTSDGTTRPVLQFLYARSNYRETKNYGASSIFRPACT